MFDGFLQQAKDELDRGETPSSLPSLLLAAHESDKHIAKEV